METVRIDTPQNVAIEYNVATIVERGFASVVDWAVMIGYAYIIWRIGMAAGGWPDWVWGVLIGLPLLLYNLLFEILMDGGSFGKRAFRIKVARLDGGRPGLGHYLMRWVLRPVDMAAFIGAVVILFNGKGQRLGDLAAGTTVISYKQRVHLRDTLLVDLPEDHVPTYPEVVRLSDEHARLVKRVLADTSTKRPFVVHDLAVKVRDQLGITTEQQPEAFLRTVLADLVALTGK